MSGKCEWLESRFGHLKMVLCWKWLVRARYRCTCSDGLRLSLKASKSRKLNISPPCPSYRVKSLGCNYFQRALETWKQRAGGTFFSLRLRSLSYVSFFQRPFDQIEFCENLVSEVVGSAGFPWGGGHPGRVLGKSPRRLLSSRRCWLLSR